MFYTNKIELPEELINIAASHSRILIVGEPNTYKGLLADTLAQVIAKNHAERGEYLQVIKEDYGINLPSDRDTKCLVVCHDFNISCIGYVPFEVMDALSQNGISTICTFSLLHNLHLKGDDLHGGHRPLSLMKHFLERAEIGIQSPVKSMDGYLMIKTTNAKADEVEISINEENYILPVRRIKHDFGLESKELLCFSDIVELVASYGNDHLRTFLEGLVEYIEEPKDMQVYVFNNRVELYKINEKTGRPNVPFRFDCEANNILTLSSPDIYGRCVVTVSKCKQNLNINDKSVAIPVNHLSFLLLDS